MPYAVITDGKRWELYDMFQPVAMKDSQVSPRFDLGTHPPPFAYRRWLSGVQVHPLEVSM